MPSNGGAVYTAICLELAPAIPQCSHMRWQVVRTVETALVLSSTESASSCGGVIPRTPVAKISNR